MSQPERKPWDGPIKVQRIGDYISISVEQNSEAQGMKISEYNAWRVFGMLAVILGVPLPKYIAKAIKL